MDFTGYLQDLKRASFYKGQIAHIEKVPARTAQFGELACPLAPELTARLEAQGLKYVAHNGRGAGRTCF